MENYDVIIIGAGIAGASLAYSLQKEQKEQKILIIDQKEIGANEAYGCRNALPQNVKKFNLPYEHKFKGFYIDAYEKPIIKYEHDFYHVNYKKACKQLIKKSKSIFKKEKAKNYHKNILQTNKNNYKFKYLIDCSGHSLFLKKLHSLKKPFKYWYGKYKIFENKTDLDTDYYHSVFGEIGFFEEFYVTPKKIRYCRWVYGEKPDFNKFNKIKHFTNQEKFKKLPLLSKGKCILPCSFVLPFAHKRNVISFGDSSGMAPPHGACGFNRYLEWSENLAKSITNNKIKEFEKKWKKENMKKDMLELVLKEDIHGNPKLIKKIKNYPPYLKLLKKAINQWPELHLNMLLNDNMNPPKEFQKSFPKRRYIFVAYYYLKLRIKYLLM
jgi:flavin-dependent dehydrogenase